MDSKSDILSALDAFIRKYYKNLLIRGTLYAVGIVVTLFLVAVLLEHLGWLSTVVRACIFWFGVVAVATVVGWFVVRPLLKMNGLGKRIDNAEAAKIIGRHFPEVSDKLLNLLQLNSQLSNFNSQLLQAAIEQKTAQLRPVPILDAIDLNGNRRYLKYALPPIAVLVVLLLAAPSSVIEPSKRIVNYQTIYERPAPFSFLILNKSLSVMQGEDFKLEITTEGEARPSEVYIDIDGRRYRMKADGEVFSYMFKQLQRSHTLSFDGGGVSSKEYRLEVMPNPTVVSFRMLLSYPAYTGRQSETVVNLGDAAVPEGTKVRWLFQTQDADSLFFGLVDGKWSVVSGVDGNGRVEMSRSIMQNIDYTFFVKNNATVSDTLRYSISSIKDAVPMILVEEAVDSVYPDRHIFRGRIKDDYGFSRLVFVHKTTNSQDTTRNNVREAELAFEKGNTSQEFYFTFNTAEIEFVPGDELEYYFEVSDNDGIHGPKSARSQVFEVKIPTEEELDKILEQSSSDVKQSADAQMSELQKLQEEINEMMRRLVDKKELNWQDKKDLEEIAKKQKQVKEMMQQMQQQIQENNRMEQRYREQSEQLMEKQRELDRLMNEVMDDKMKETMQEIERMMKELDKNKVQQQLEQLKMDNADLERQIDQNIELMKRLEIEKKVEQTIQKMDKLAEEQRNVSRETEQAKNKDKSELMQKQQEISEKFQKLKEDINQIKQDYKELDPSTDFKVPTELEQQVEQHQKEAQQSLQKGKNKEAGKQQQQAADDMKQLSEALAEAQVEAEQQDLAEDAEQVRQLLKNLVRLSFNQEALISDLNTIYIQDPKYQTIISRQNRIKDDFRGVEDSLRSMARRQIQVASAITKNVSEVNSNISKTLSGLLEMNQSFYGTYKNTNAARSMQYSMTSLNNLALVMAESLDQMQNQMRQNSQKQKSGQCKNKGKSNSQCSNPGKGKPSPKSMRQMQEELNKQMDALKKQLDKQGKKDGGRHQIGQGQSMSEEFARMAAQQEMIRRMMQEYGQEMKSASGGDPKLAREIDQMMKQMEQTETDLVNRTITQQTLQRQQQIMTRLLQHEKAEMEREKEERRESHEASDIYSQPSPAELEKYKRQLKPASDQLRSVPPTLSPYYRDKVNDYFYR